MKGSAWHNMLHYALPLGATCLSTQEFPFYSEFLPLKGLPNMAVSVTLARNQGGGRIPSSPAWRQRGSSFLLTTEGPVWSAAWE